MNIILMKADFIEKMDQNPYLLGFKNGVVDFKEKCFRVGYPEDYITKSTKMDYIPKEKKVWEENGKYIVEYHTKKYDDEGKSRKHTGISR